MSASASSPPAPVVGVGVVLFKTDRVLLVKRARAPMAGAWSLPGGRQHLGETACAAAARELREETGIEAEIHALLDVVDYIDRGPDGEIRHHFTLIDYLALWRRGEPAPASDAAEAVWAGLAELARFALWDETRRVIFLGAARLGLKA